MMDGMNPDADADAQELQPVKDALIATLDLVKAMGERLEALEDLVVNKLIGGLSGEAERRGREQIGGSLRSNYPDLGKYSDFYQGVYGKDVYDDVLDQAWPAIKDSGFDQGRTDEIVKSIAESLHSKLGKFIGGAGPEAPVSMAEEGPEEAPEEGDGFPPEMSPKIKAVLIQARAARGPKKGA